MTSRGLILQQKLHLDVLLRSAEIKRLNSSLYFEDIMLSVACRLFYLKQTSVLAGILPLNFYVVS